MRKLNVALASCALLAGCGGGDSGGGKVEIPAVTPTPTASPSPTPTPTPASPFYLSLAPNPGASVSFDIADFIGFQYNGDPATGQILAGSPTSGENPRVAFKYDQATQSYTLVTLDLVTQQERFILFSTPLSATNPSYSDARFLGYSGSTFGNNATGIFRLYRSGNANPDLKLSYSGFGNLSRSGPSGYLNFADSWFGYGIATKWGDVPASGTSTYSGVLHGFAVDTAAGQQYKVEGTASLNLDFATQKLSGTLNMTLVSKSGARTSLGVSSFSGADFGSLPGTATNFRANTLTGSDLPYGVMQGMLYGPRAVEISGVFAGTISRGSTVGGITAQGGFAVVKN
ncbi:MAG: transferrin-binding protein-like solute binding protein [Sphingobium sp.]|nr:transferrin-binding protein-like solute binding protein [Sphingobium sp.]